MLSPKELVSQIKTAFNFVSTSSLSFRIMSRADAFPLYDATRHPDFNKNLIWDQPSEEAEMVQEVDLLLREDMTNDAVLVSVCEKYTGTWVGFIKITAYRASVRFSIWAHPNYWRKGYAIKAVDVAVKTVFDCTEVSEVYARVKKDYAIVERIVKSLGARFIEPDSVQHKSGHIMEDGVWQLDRCDWSKEVKVLNY